MLSIVYAIEPDLPTDEFIDVLKQTSLGARRPVDDRPRIAEMLRQADLIVTARHSSSQRPVGRSVAGSHRLSVLYLSVGSGGR